MTVNEDDLCHLFANKIATSQEFASWVLSRTKFSKYRLSTQLLHEEQALMRPHVLPERWWRHWWCTVPELSHQRETDIFLVFGVPDKKKRFALLIENKKDSEFLEGQAEGYEPKGRFMMEQEKYLNFTEFETLLIVPLQFRNRHRAKCDLFNDFISYEDIAKFIPEFTYG